MKRLLMLAAIAMIAPWSIANAQQQEPSLKPSVSPRTDVRKQFLLEIIYNAKLPPAYSTVDGVDSVPKWIWVTRFVRIPAYKPASSELPIRAVKLESQFNGETADVRLTLLRGGQTFEKEQLVNVYQLGVGEERMLSELTEFGIEPFNIKLIEAVPPIPPPPAFNNLTKSIEVVRVQSHNIPKPAYTITFRNLSEKNIAALKVDVTSDGRPGVTTMFQGKEGNALIEAGGVSEQYIMVVKPERTATTYVPGTASSNIINIRSAVFSDLSFEGDSEPACMFETFVMGRRVWLRKVVALLDQETTKTTGDHIAAAKQFKEKFSALTYDPDDSERRQASVVSPKCMKPAERSFMATLGLKLQLLRDLDRIIETRPAPPVNFRLWMLEKRDTYKAWLSRL
jgi:hypothetical protein